jgi:integrase
MRAGEACQLRACDVTRVGGVDVIWINDAAGSIKNKPSLRDVPLHPKCRDLLRLAKSKAPDEYLFDYPMWKHSRAGKFQQRANAWLRSIGITDKNITVYSWRHTWRTMARELNMPEPISRAILGHTLGSGDHGKYGEAPSLKLRAR